MGGDDVVRVWHKGLYLTFALAYQVQRYGLNPSRRKPVTYLLPQQGAQCVAHKPVEDSACLLSVYLVHVYVVRTAHGGSDCVCGYLVEPHPALLRQVHSQNIGQMPRNGFTFAVRVRGQQNT